MIYINKIVHVAEIHLLLTHDKCCIIPLISFSYADP